MNVDLDFIYYYQLYLIHDDHHFSYTLPIVLFYFSNFPDHFHLIPKFELYEVKLGSYLINVAHACVYTGVVRYQCEKLVLKNPASPSRDIIAK